MSTIPDHLIDKAARGAIDGGVWCGEHYDDGPRQDCEDCVHCARVIALDVLETVADDLRAEGAREALAKARAQIDLTDYPPEHGYVNAGAAAAHWLADFRDQHYPERKDQ